MVKRGGFMRDKPRPQELYRHFKGNLYQIVTIAIHSETREEMVVYQALYGEYKTYVRPLSMFMSEVDREKYPDVKQKMRFEKVTIIEDQKVPAPSAATDSAASIVTPVAAAASAACAPEVVKPEIVRPETTKSSERKIPHGLFGFDKTPPKESKVMSKSVDEEAKELNLDPLVIEFMDADLAVDKNDILTRLKPTITNEMIDIMAMSLGVVVKEGDVYDRFNDLRTCLNTIEKFESTRLRS